MSKAQLFSSAKRDGGFAPNNFSYPISFLTKFLKLAAAWLQNLTTATLRNFEPNNREVWTFRFPPSMHEITLSLAVTWRKRRNIEKKKEKMRGKVDAWIRRRRAFTGERHLIRSHIRILSLEEEEAEQGRIIRCILSFLRCGLGTNFLEMLDVACHTYLCAYPKLDKKVNCE